MTGSLLSTLAESVRQRREELGLSQKAAAAAGGLSAMTWNRVEVQAKSVKPLSYSGVERALDWAPGSIRAFLGGGALPDLAPTAPASTDTGPGLYVATDGELLDELARRIGHSRRSPVA